MQLFAAQFHTLDRWDAKAARVALHRSTHSDFRSLREFIEEVTELVAPWEEPDKEWPVYGVDNVNGVFFSHRQLGSKFRQKYKRIRKGWFFHNPTRSAVGSLGMVPDVPKDAITSPEYQVWHVTSGFLPEFLAIMIRTEAFKRLIRIHRVGAVKERLFVRNLQEITVPIPSLSKQEDIVERHCSAMTGLEQARNSGVAAMGELRQSILRELGLDQDLTCAHRDKVFALNWHEVERWGVSFSRSGSSSFRQLLSRGKYPLASLGSVLNLVQYGSSQKANSHGRGIPIIRINNVKNGALDLTDLKHIQQTRDAVEGLILRDGDILVIRTSGSRQLVGTSAVFHESGEFLFASYLIRLRTDPTKADPDFVSWVLNSSLGRRQIEAVSRKIMQNNINTEELRNLQIPLPPLPGQREIVRQANGAHDEVTQVLHAAESRLKEVESEVQALLLGID